MCYWSQPRSSWSCTKLVWAWQSTKGFYEGGNVLLSGHVTQTLTDVGVLAAAAVSPVVTKIKASQTRCSLGDLCEGRGGGQGGSHGTLMSNAIENIVSKLQFYQCISLGVFSLGSMFATNECSPGAYA
eukprot:1156184-Pelagomonas_calceolata.AAC.22